MIWVGCPNCKSKDYKYSIDFSVTRGYTNPVNHFLSCAGSTDNVIEIVQARQNAKQLTKPQEQGSKKAESEQPVLQQTLSTCNFPPSEFILSIHMWITKIVIKNMPIYDVKCAAEREMVHYSKVKLVKTVIDTSHFLMAIVEDKISNMMKTAPASQIIFDGYTVGGQPYVAIFSSFMRKCTSMSESIEHKYDKHELRLLACAPLPPVSADNE